MLSNAEERIILVTVNDASRNDDRDATKKAVPGRTCPLSGSAFQTSLLYQCQTFIQVTHVTGNSQLQSRKARHRHVGEKAMEAQWGHASCCL